MHYTQVYNSHAVSAETAGWIRRMPKVEIHVHLEGATDAEQVFGMAGRNGVRLPAATLAEWQAYYAFRDFDHFIEIYMLAVSAMRTPQDFVDMAVRFLERQAAQNIVYSEAFFSTGLHQGKLPADELVAALAEGARLGETRTGARMRLIPDLSRELCQAPERQAYVLDFALRARDCGLGVGLGIGGKEIGYPPELYADLFAEARRQGLRVVAHGGETSRPASIWGALEALGAERIGHGLRCLDDPALVTALRERQVPLEVSPQSNYCTRVVDWGKPHPIGRMVAAGLNCSVNSDDPPMFATDLNNEYLTLAAQGFTREQLWQLNLNGLEAAFLAPAEKRALRARWEAWRAGEGA